MNKKYLSSLFYAPAKEGKTTLAFSGPGPYLVFDGDAGGSDEHITSGETVEWDILKDYKNPPVNKETVIVPTFSNRTIRAGIHVIKKNILQPKTVIWDNVTEFQRRIKREIKPLTKIEPVTDGKKEKDNYALWNTLLDSVEDHTALLKIATRAHPTVESFVFICGSRESLHPITFLLQGGIVDYLPYKFDVVGYLKKDVETEERTLQIKKTSDVYACNRLGEKWNEVVLLNKPSIGKLMKMKYHGKENSVQPKE